MCVGKRHGAWIGRVDRRRTALAWAGPGGCMDAEGSPCPRCAVVGIVAGTVACMPRALDEEMARVIRLVCALLIVLVGLLAAPQWVAARSAGHTSDRQSLMRIS